MYVEAPAHFLPIGEAWQGLVVGLFPPSIGGPLHKPRSSGAVSAGCPGCQTTCPEGTGISPCLESGGQQCGVVIIHL